MSSKKVLIGLLILVVAAEVGFYVYKKMKSWPDRRTVTIAVSSVEDASVLEGVKEGVELAVAGVNVTKSFSVRLAFHDNNPLAAIAADKDMLIIRVGGIDTLVIPQGGTPSAVFSGKIKSVYGHNPSPFSAEAFDAVKLIAAGVSRIPVGAVVNAETLRAVFAGLRSYTGESGAMQFDEQGIGRR